MKKNFSVGILLMVVLIPFYWVGFNFIRTDNLNQIIATGDLKAVEETITAGVKVNGRGMHGITPLMKAAGLGRLDICEILIKHGADVNGHNDSGNVLMWAVDSGNEDLVRFLLKSGSDPEWRNAIGGNAESMAKERGFTNIIKILQMQGARPELNQAQFRPQALDRHGQEMEQSP